MADRDDDITLAREIMRTVFGLNKNVIDTILREVRATTGITPLKNHMIRKRVGTHSTRMLRNSLNAAKEYYQNPANQDSLLSQYDDEEDPDQFNSPSTGGEYTQPEKNEQDTDLTDPKQKANESFTYLKEFLVDIDPNDDEELVRIRRMMRQAQRPGGEERLARQFIQNANDERDEKRSNGNTPTENIDRQISKLKVQLARLQRRKAALERHDEEQKQNGTQKKQHKDQDV